MVSILKLNCPDAVGLLAQITGAIAQHGGNLLEVSQYTDVSTGWFFARLAIEKGREPGTRHFHQAFAPIASRLRAVWSMRLAESKTRTVILVSKQEHCLVDLLWRWRSGELGIEVPLVISNHETCRTLVERERIPFEFVPFDEGKPDAFDKIGELAAQRPERNWSCSHASCRFCRVGCADEYAARIINIHHSFLPAFIGANPYQRAFERGVKLIGATCHYATAELDAGPIIEQEVARVEHYHDPEDLVRLGRDSERLASRARRSLSCRRSRPGARRPRPSSFGTEAAGHERSSFPRFAPS